MPGIASLEAFQRGVNEFNITDFQVDIEPAALAAARQSLEESGLLLLGEVHGVRQNALVARSLMETLGITGLALEWPAGLAASISRFFEDGRVPDNSLLWGGDGRITAGHFALLWERFHAGRLEALTLFDGVNEVGWSKREAAMAERILTAQGPAARTLVIAGSAHTALGPTGLGVPLGARLAEQRPGVREVRIKYGNGSYYNLSPQRFKRQWSFRRRIRLHLDGTTLMLELPGPVQARVPHRVSRGAALRPAAPGYTGSFPAARTGEFPAMGTGGFPAAQTGGFPVAQTGGNPAARTGGFPAAPPGGPPGQAPGQAPGQPPGQAQRRAPQQPSQPPSHQPPWETSGPAQDQGHGQRPELWSQPPVPPVPPGPQAAGGQHASPYPAQHSVPGERPFPAESPYQGRRRQGAPVQPGQPQPQPGQPQPGQPQPGQPQTGQPQTGQPQQQQPRGRLPYEVELPAR